MFIESYHHSCPLRRSKTQGSRSCGAQISSSPGLYKHLAATRPTASLRDFALHKRLRATNLGRHRFLSTGVFSRIAQ
jgi:hypothetical protein